MDILTIALIAFAVWVALLGLVLAMCKAAARADADSADERAHPTVLTPRPAAQTPPSRRIVRQA